MQLIAFDDQEKRIPASSAEKKINYYCPQCRSVLRLRSGLRIQAHFYHFQKKGHCLHRKKSLAHLHNQLFLLERIPSAILEHPFPSISRIADVFWPEKNIVFEIQYSPMSVSEAEKREMDYRSLGMEIVWILHDARYNRRRLAPVEHFLSTRNTYYTSIKDKGSGLMYDQFEIRRGFERPFKGARFSIDPTKPYLLSSLSLPSNLPSAFLQRFATRSLGFAGDLIDTAFQDTSHNFSPIIHLENRYLKSPKRMPLLKNLAAIYRAFFYALLEKVFLR